MMCTKVEVKQEAAEQGTRKTPGKVLKMKARKKRKRGPRMKRQSKRKKTNSDLQEEEHLKTFLKIVPDEEGIIDLKSWRRDFQSLTGNQNSIILTDMKQSASTTGSLDLMEVLDGLKPFLRCRLMKLEAIIEERMIFKCWFHHHTTNGHHFTMSNRHQELASPEQTAFGKDFSNPLMADSLPKTTWLSMHHVVAMKHWLFQSKRLLVKKYQIHL
ncbi:hypothetical protein Tco_0189827 [Tanacetum coccineum]